MTQQEPSTSQSQFAEMHERARASRMKFLKELQQVPKLPPGKLILCVGWSLMMASLDNTIVNIANPSIQKWKAFVPEGEQIPQSTIQWINDLYSISFAAFAIPASKIGDRFGVTVVHRFGVMGFVLFSVLCGVSAYINYETTHIKYGGFYFLLTFRFFQGIFAAFNMSNSMSLCGILVEQKDVPKSMAYNSLAFSAATAFGPVLGGFLTEYCGWSWCFFINFFIGVAAITVCWIKLPKTPKFQEDKLDWFGGVIVMIGLMIMVFGFTYIPPDKNAVAVGVVATLVGIGIVISFIFWETMHPFAILPQKLLRNKKIMYSFLAGLFNFALIVTVSFQMPFIIQSILGYSPSVAGLITIVNPFAQIISSIGANKLGNIMTTYIIKLVVSILNASFLIILGGVARYGIGATIPLMFCYSLVMGMFFVSNNSFMMSIATPDIRGMIGGCVQAFRETGYAVGIAFVNLIHDIYMGAVWGDAPIPTDRDSPEWAKYCEDYNNAFLTTNCCMSVCVIAAMLFAMASGVGDYEKGKIGYKWYTDRQNKKLGITSDEKQALIEEGEEQKKDAQPEKQKEGAKSQEQANQEKEEQQATSEKQEQPDEVKDQEQEPEDQP